MRLELTGRHIEITPSIRRVVAAKLARLDRLLNDSALSAQVVLTQEKDGTRADVTLHARGEKFLHAAGKAPGWPGSMAQAAERLAQQAKTVKGKWQARKRRPRILRASRQVITPMSLSEAARRLDGDGGIVVFRDVETSAISVLYRGQGGELTLVEAEP